MPVLDTERSPMPRSALRYRPIYADDQARPGTPVTHPRRNSPDDLEAEQRHIPRQRSVTPARPASTKRRLHPLFFISLVLLLTALLWVGISEALTWTTNEWNTLKYGDPRTFQIDQVVGQGDSVLHPSHFLAVNVRGVVTILEFPAGDPGRARVLATTSITGTDADLEIVTLRFIDVNHNGRPDMLVDIGGVQSVLINDGSSFRPPTPVEQQQILEALQQGQ